MPCLWVRLRCQAADNYLHLSRGRGAKRQGEPAWGDHRLCIHMGSLRMDMCCYERGCVCFLCAVSLLPPACLLEATGATSRHLSKEKDPIYRALPDLGWRLVVPHTRPPAVPHWFRLSDSSCFLFLFPFFFLSLSFVSPFCSLSILPLSHLQFTVCWNKAYRIVWHLTSFVSQSRPLGSYQNLLDIGLGQVSSRQFPRQNRRPDLICLAVAGNIGPRGHSTTPPPTGVGRRMERKRQKLVGQDKGSYRTADEVNSNNNNTDKENIQNKQRNA